MKMKKINGIRRCRLCACEEDFSNFYNIFNDNPEMQLEMKITKLLPIVVMPWDPMPHIVCHKCIEKLNLFNDFYETSIKAERILRTLHPSAPENDLEDINPVVEVIDSPILESLSKSSLKLPLKKRQGIPPSSYNKSQKDGSPEYIDITPSPEQPREDMYPKRTLNCFIINQISSRDSVFTCRECFRTFTKQSSALTHSCVRIEDCAEIESLEVDDEAEKSLPPLKIRLFSVRSGLFVCYLCQAPFEEKTEVIEHIRRHLEDGKKTGKQKGRRKARCLEGTDEDDNWENTYKKKAVRRKRRKCSGPPKKRGRPKSGETMDMDECETGTCAKCGLCHESPTVNSPAKETMERTTQYSEISDNSEEEIQNKAEETSMNLNPPPEIQPRCEEITNNVRVQEVVFDEPEQNHPEESRSVTAEDIARILEAGPEPEPEPEPELEPEPEPEPNPHSVPETDNISDEITVLEVINNKTPTSFSSCVFCDKIFATKDALISHQNKHLQGISEVKSESDEKSLMEVSRIEEETFLCSICAMIFTDMKMLLEHEQYHLAEMEAMACQRRIRIALAHEFANRDTDQECQISKSRGIITITVTAGEKKIPQIEFI